MVGMTAGVINLIIFKNWNIYTAVIFGIVVCATDPLAVDDAVKVSGIPYLVLVMTSKRRTFLILFYYCQSSIYIKKKCLFVCLFFVFCFKQLPNVDIFSKILLCRFKIKEYKTKMSCSCSSFSSRLEL